MRAFCGLFAKEIRRVLEDEGEPPFRAGQLFDWVYQKGKVDYQQMANLPQGLRGGLGTVLALGLLHLETIESSSDGETEKFLWRLKDHRLVESVLIMSKQRRTVCVSSQVGCPARCAFCASGKEGMIRNLTAGEIVEQVVQIQHHLVGKGERVTHIAFMGMGEPLENYEEVLKALKIFIDPALFALSQRRITLSTVGVVPQMKRLMGEGLKVNLAVSLHAPNQQLRKKIVPYARKFPLEEVLQSAREYAMYTRRDLTYEYVLLEGINDQVEHAEELAALLGREQCTVNLIPYNPIAGVSFAKPHREVIEQFEEILVQKGIVVTRRYTKGKDIAAACGQLALLHER